MFLRLHHNVFIPPQTKKYLYQFAPTMDYFCFKLNDIKTCYLLANMFQCFKLLTPCLIFSTLYKT